MTDYPTIPSGAIDAIVYGYHGDPFSILGPHPVENGMVIRFFLPTAREVNVVWADQSSQPMVRSHDAGFFELLVWDRQPPAAYQFQIFTYNDESYVIDDPYSFPTQISEFDEHLLAEGNHFEIYYSPFPAPETANLPPLFTVELPAMPTDPISS